MLSQYKILLNKPIERILFVDTETTGVPIEENANYKNIDNWPRIKQIAWIVYKKDGTFDSSFNIYITESDRTDIISVDNTHKGTAPIYLTLNSFLDSLYYCDVIVGHNIDYDVKVILCELYRFGKDTAKLESIQRFCTMKNSVKICGFDTRRGDRYPKLQELYSKLFHQPFDNAHDAYCDIKATADCYWKMFNDGLLNKEDYPYLLSTNEKYSVANKLINSAVEIVDKYVGRGCDVNDEKPLVALSIFDKAMSLQPYSLLLKEKVGRECLKCAREMYSGGDMTTSFRFFEKAAETDFGEALAAQATLVNDENEEKDLLLRAIEKGWTDAAYSLCHLYNRKGDILSAKKYSEMWLDYCERNFDNLPNNIAFRYIRGFLYGDLGHPADLDKAKTLCERSIAHGRDNYGQYAKALELSEEWDKRFKVLSDDFEKYMDKIEQEGGVDTMKKWGHSRERRGILYRLSPLVECLFEGKGTSIDYFKAKELVDLGISLYDGYSSGIEHEELGQLFYYMGRCYEEGLADVTVNYESAFKCYVLAAKDISQAAKQLGILYLQGRGCKKSKKKAREYLKIAKSKGLDVSPYLEKASSWF